MSVAATPPRTVAVTVDRHDAHPWITRVTTGLALLGVAVAAAMAVWGLPPVDLHGPLHHAGVMTPGCGGTRAARLTAQGDLVGAWTYNPLGLVVVVGAALVLARTTTGLLTRRWVNLHLSLSTRQRRAVWLVVIVLLVLLEIRQQQRADLLMAWGSTR